jgi:hypothetical protein
VALRFLAQRERDEQRRCCEQDAHDERLEHHGSDRGDDHRGERDHRDRDLVDRRVRHRGTELRVRFGVVLRLVRGLCVRGLLGGLVVAIARDELVKPVEHQSQRDEQKSRWNHELKLEALVHGRRVEAGLARALHLLRGLVRGLVQRAVDALGERERDHRAHRVGDGGHEVPTALGQQSSEHVDREVPAPAGREAGAEKRSPQRPVHQEVARVPAERRGLLTEGVHQGLRAPFGERHRDQSRRGLTDRHADHGDDDDQRQGALSEQNATVDGVDGFEKWCGFRRRSCACHRAGERIKTPLFNPHRKPPVRFSQRIAATRAMNAASAI